MSEETEQEVDHWKGRCGRMKTKRRNLGQECKRLLREKNTGQYSCVSRDKDIHMHSGPKDMEAES